jgi:hypothetical protein
MDFLGGDEQLDCFAPSDQARETLGSTPSGD